MASMHSRECAKGMCEEMGPDLIAISSLLLRVAQNTPDSPQRNMIVEAAILLHDAAKHETNHFWETTKKYCKI